MVPSPYQQQPDRVPPPNVNFFRLLRAYFLGYVVLRYLGMAIQGIIEDGSISFYSFAMRLEPLFMLMVAGIICGLIHCGIYYVWLRSSQAAYDRQWQMAVSVLQAVIPIAIVATPCLLFGLKGVLVPMLPLLGGAIPVAIVTKAMTPDEPELPPQPVSIEYYPPDTSVWPPPPTNPS